MKFFIKSIKYFSPVIIFIIILTSLKCRKDPLENYRELFSGIYEFTTVIESYIQSQSEIIDTTYFTGEIRPVYSNRDDIIEIHFTPDLKIDPIIDEAGKLTEPSWWNNRGQFSIEGGFNEDKTRALFIYQSGTGMNWLVYRVTGFKLR